MVSYLVLKFEIVQSEATPIKCQQHDSLNPSRTRTATKIGKQTGSSQAPNPHKKVRPPRNADSRKEVSSREEHTPASPIPKDQP